jgi:hypothetical protein
MCAAQTDSKSAMALGISNGLPPLVKLLELVTNQCNVVVSLGQVAGGPMGTDRDMAELYTSIDALASALKTTSGLTGDLSRHIKSTNFKSLE